MTVKKIVNHYYAPFINIYTVWILYLLFFASFRDFPVVPFEIKIMPFNTISTYFKEVINYDKPEFIKNIVGNIILFIPFGFLGILYTKLDQLIWLLITFFITINILEFSQYYFNRGMADVDDVILNTLGVIIGYVIYRKFFQVKD